MMTMTRLSFNQLPLLLCCYSVFLPNAANGFGGVTTMLPFLHDLTTHLPTASAAAALHHSSSMAGSLFHPSNSIDYLHHATASSTSSLISTTIASTAAVTTKTTTSSTGTVLLPSVVDSIIEMTTKSFDQYRTALNEHPLKVKIITGCILAVVGDALAQQQSSSSNRRQHGEGEGEGGYDTMRAAAFVAFDGCWRAVQQFTYPPLIKACHGQYLMWVLGTTFPFLHVQDQDPFLYAAMEQTLISQLVMIPLLYYPVFYCITGMVQGLTIDQTISRAKETFIPLMKRNLLFWIPVQFGTFGYIEENLQIPVLIVCGLVWTVILSLSAGSVDRGTVTTKDDNDDDNDIDNIFCANSIETNMKELSVAEGTLSVNDTSFFFATNHDDVSTYSTHDNNNDNGNNSNKDEELNSIWMAQNVDNLQPSNVFEEQDAYTK